MPKVYPAFTYQDPKPENLNASLGFSSHSSERHMHKPPRDGEPSIHATGIYVHFQFIWLSGKCVWGIQVPLGLNPCD